MYDYEDKIYKQSYDLHRLFYETPEESRDDDFWRQIGEGLKGFSKYNSQASTLRIINRDIYEPHGRYVQYKQLGINAERVKAAEREREETAQAEARTKALADVLRLEMELAEAKAAL